MAPIKKILLLLAGGSFALGLTACDEDPPAPGDAAAPDARQADQLDAGATNGPTLPVDSGNVAAGDSGSAADAAPASDEAGAAVMDAGNGPDAAVTTPAGEDAGPIEVDAATEAGEPPGEEITCAEDADACGVHGLVCDPGTLTCVRCSMDGPTSCPDGDYCDDATGQCASLAPWRPDCASPPPNTPCEAGPREVLLVTNARGLVAMFDSENGEFLGNLKHETRPFADAANEYSLATQGPDMCIWTTREGDSAGQVGIERWDTDGTRLDEVIPFDTHYVEAEGRAWDVLEDPLSLGFTEEHVYVASSGSSRPLVSRFTLDGEFVDVVLDEGTRATGMQVLADGRLVLGAAECAAGVTTSISSCFIASGVYGEVFVVDPQSGERTDLWKDVEPRQIWYAGGGRVLSHDHSLGGALASLDIRTQERTVVAPSPSLEHSKGIAALGDGRWLVTSTEDSILAIDPEAPSAPAESLWNDVSVLDTRGFQQVGRACVPEAVIEAARSAVGSPCPEPPQGAALLSRDFEEDEGDFYVDGGAAGSQRSLRVVGDTGVNINLPAPARPMYVGFHVRTSAFNGSSTRAGMVNTEDIFTEAAVLRDGAIQTVRSRVSQAMLPDTWYRVEFTDIDWDAQHLDICIDGTIAAEKVAFDPQGEFLIDRIAFGNQDPEVTSWIDEVLVK